MRIVVALGGRALHKRGEPSSPGAQRESARIVARAVAPLVPEHELVISHGNGPQGELLAMQAIIQGTPQNWTMDFLDTRDEDIGGYMFEQELSNLLPPEVPVAAILNMVEVDPQDPAFRKP